MENESKCVSIYQFVSGSALMDVPCYLALWCFHECTVVLFCNEKSRLRDHSPSTKKAFPKCRKKSCNLSSQSFSMKYHPLCALCSVMLWAVQKAAGSSTAAAAKVEAPCVFYCNAPSPTKTLYSWRIHFGSTRAAMGSGAGRKRSRAKEWCSWLAMPSNTLSRKKLKMCNVFQLTFQEKTIFFRVLYFSKQ